MSSSVSGSRVSSRLRDSNGVVTLKNGFSVVAATRVTQRFSTLGSSASCCVLEKRWTSSMNRTVWVPVSPSARLASSMTWRTSFTPAVTADSSRQRRLVAAGDGHRERGLAGAGRAPEDHAERGVALDHPAQRRALGQQVALADDLVQRARPHPDGERSDLRGSVPLARVEQRLLHPNDPTGGAGSRRTGVSAHSCQEWGCFPRSEGSLRWRCGAALCADTQAAACRRHDWTRPTTCPGRDITSSQVNRSTRHPRRSSVFSRSRSRR